MNPTIGMFVGDEEIERRRYGRRCQHNLPIAADCDECNAQAEFEEGILEAAANSVKDSEGEGVEDDEV